MHLARFGLRDQERGDSGVRLLNRTCILREWQYFSKHVILENYLKCQQFDK